MPFVFYLPYSLLLPLLKKVNMIQLQNYINGSLTTPISNEYLDNYNPSTGKVYSKKLSKLGAILLKMTVLQFYIVFPL